MKIAVLSDIHGNIAALDAVLADAADRGADRIVNLGDICSGGLFPVETADRLMALDLPTIRGNHERQLLEQAPEHMGLSDRHAARTLRPEHLAWLAALPETAWLTHDILLVHGTPGSDLAYFLETVTEDGIRAATPAEVKSRIGAVCAPVILCGHTHIPHVVVIEDGPLIVNPGSVGLPAYDDTRPYPHKVETGSPHARYAMLTQADGAWQAELLCVDYDWEQAARDAEANGRPDWARALRTGRV
ncbi:metallophosphoesterase family protein [Sphingobium sp. CCH11-B1]|jgi:predicted phosphodiesterase|uniref:metallophosphoesterase family protein n=1 Tax=Sphingobium sp. CCH11-B1 TaxID=1768781 RepID=UPI000832FA2D|nr:metallophosphoesterase family protein [Sphingobium sp. CCH11-B1]MEA3391092.1 metallophosphoesterase family protein [Pseudomonadota bacterium]